MDIQRTITTRTTTISGGILMCILNGYKRMPDKTLEKIYKGSQHKLSKLIQESQGEIDLYV